MFFFFSKKWKQDVWRRDGGPKVGSSLLPRDREAAVATAKFYDAHRPVCRWLMADSSRQIYCQKRTRPPVFWQQLYMSPYFLIAQRQKKGSALPKKKKLQRFFFFSKIFFWPESLIASPAQVKLVGAVRFQSAPIGFYDGREDTKKKSEMLPH